MMKNKALYYLQGCNFKLDMYFSNFLLRMISAPYFAWVPLSTSRKYAWRLFSTANLELARRKKRRKNISGQLELPSSNAICQHSASDKF